MQKWWRRTTGQRFRNQLLFVSRLQSIVAVLAIRCERSGRRTIFQIRAIVIVVVVIAIVIIVIVGIAIVIQLRQIVGVIIIVANWRWSVWMLVLRRRRRWLRLMVIVHVESLIMQLRMVMNEIVL